MTITASIVLYDNPKEMVNKAVESFLSSPMAGDLYLIDHSLGDEARSWYDKARIKYIHEENKGYGAGHNTAMRACLSTSQYHVILNPDIYFDRDVITKLAEFCESDSEAALVMPKILYPDGEIQYLCKLLPTPTDWFIRRFIKAIRDDRFELRATGYNTIMDIPYLSGCFMFLRMDALREIGLFDERFFLHCEDTDLSRRLHKKHKTIFFPDAVVIHEHQKESHKSLKMLAIHVRSTIEYFNKWGWFFDSDRKSINDRTVERYL